jgi:peptidoglycan/LPS O-acetylase OafA/YrhL
VASDKHKTLTLAYRREVDGLRALAVLPVVFFHAGFTWFRGGYVGVDIFFVISGYLITTIILNEKQAGVFSIKRFYERRARRILPALFVVLLACLIPAWLWLVPAQLRNFSTTTAAVSLFASNFFFWRIGGYFGPLAEENPLIHTWSLAVEEQYYMVFPLFITSFWFLGIRGLGLLILGVALASLGFSEYALEDGPVAAFFLTPTRAWELFVGALVAFLSFRTPLYERFGTARRQVLAALGLMLLLLAIFLFDESTPFPGLYALVPTMGSALIIAFASGDTLVGRLLSLKYVVGLGLISYSLYLWHQPLFAFARVANPHSISAFLLVFLTILSIGLAYLTWRYVETPFRRRGTFTSRQIFAGSVAMSVALIALGAGGYLAKGFPGRYGPAPAQLLSTAVPSPKRMPCHTSGKAFITPGDACKYFSDNVTWAVLGDSHGVEPAYGLAERLRPNDGVLHLTFSACPPALLFDAHTVGCRQWLTESVEYLERHAEIRNVVLTFRHSYYLFGDSLDFFPDTPTRRPRFLRSFNADEAREEYWKSFTALVQRLLSAEKRVYVLFPVPELGKPVAGNIHRANILGEHIVSEHGLKLDYYKARNAYILEKLSSLPWSDDLIPIRPQDELCDERQCYAVKKGIAMYFDDNHLSLSGAMLIAQQIARANSAIVVR